MAEIMDMTQGEDKLIEHTDMHGNISGVPINVRSSKGERLATAPAPEQVALKMRAKGNTAEIRSMQAKFARDFAQIEIERLRKSIYKNKRQVGDEIVSYTPAELEEVSAELQVVEAVATKLSQQVAELANGLTLDEWQFRMPGIWHGLMKEAKGGPEYVTDENAPEPMPMAGQQRSPTVDELEVIAPPVPMQTLEDAIDGTMDVSPLELPEQPNTAQILGKIAEDNASD